ncbi:MFS transporter [Clostridium magnum]|uniref:Glucuronide carrier protein n=1 Tax=Clostridium magnum DSM 2767 TaxID=1121326 RepID=A0A162R391_9CLOT|nr:MFS transporter [Clostridium magnum]KZL89363.1 glucuronide carrier protein [Clostridium magnum DSM 2767]SHI21010.1 glycoside/pentoside/hexuronide:cation symporter, GPH family [Clostridium magnum DSM 2767]
MVKTINLYEKSGSNPGFYKLGNKEVVGYSLVDGGMNLVFQSILMFLMFYYTDVYGLTAVEVSVMFLVSRVWDMIWDPAMGIITERLNPKRGKYKSYLLYGAIPFGIAGALTYTVPNFGHTGKLIWAYFTYNLLMTLYTFIINPYVSCTTVMTADPMERTRLNSIRMMVAQSGGVVVAVFIPVLSQFFGGDNVAKGYQMTVILLSIITTSILIYSYTTLHERIRVKSHLDPVSFKGWIEQITHNQPGVVLFFLFMGVYAFSSIQSASGIYYMNYNVNRKDLVALFSILNVLPSVIAVPFVPMMFRRIKKKNTVALGLLLGAIGSAVLYIIPVSQIAAMMIFKSVASFGYGILMGSIWSIIPDSVEYAEYNTGNRYAAVVYTLITLGLKASLAIGGFVPTFILAKVGYVANVHQTPEALNGILIMTSILPAVVCVVTLIIFMIFYNLTEERVAEIMAELDIRHKNDKENSRVELVEEISAQSTTL